MMTCAPLRKSPNCASQITSASGVVEAVAEVEAEDALLREGAVADLEAPGVLGDPREGGVAVARLGVEEHGVAVAEGAAPHVLARDAHRRLVGEEGGVGEHLAGAPVEGLAGDERVVARLEDGEHLGVRRGSRAAARAGARERLAGCGPRVTARGHLGRGRVEAAAVARPHAAHGVGDGREAALLHVVERGGEGLAPGRRRWRRRCSSVTWPIFSRRCTYTWRTVGLRSMAWYMSGWV